MEKITRQQLAQMLALDKSNAFNFDREVTYPDTGRVSNSPADALESYLQAPFRKAIYQMQDGNLGGVMDQ